MIFKLILDNTIFRNQFQVSFILNNKRIYISFKLTRRLLFVNVFQFYPIHPCKIRKTQNRRFF